MPEFTDWVDLPGLKVHTAADAHPTYSDEYLDAPYVTTRRAVMDSRILAAVRAVADVSALDLLAVAVIDAAVGYRDAWIHMDVDRDGLLQYQNKRDVLLTATAAYLAGDTNPEGEPA